MNVTSRVRERFSLCLVVAMTLSAGLCTSTAFAEEDAGIWPLSQKVSFHRRGEPPSFDVAKVFGLPVAATLAALKSPLELFHMTSPFGWREKPHAKKRKFHYGVDYAAPFGTPIYAAQDGLVEAMGKRRGFGYYVKLRHDNGVETGYGHLTRFASDVSRGSVVQCGDLLGYVGSTGRATGPHLHYEVLVDGIPVNPEEKFQESAEPLKLAGH